MKQYLACFQRERLKKICKNKGLYRVQKSIFLGLLNKNQKDEMVVLVSNVSAVSEELAATTEEVAATTHQFGETIHTLTNMSKQIAESVVELEEKIAHFKVQE